MGEDAGSAWSDLYAEIVTTNKRPCLLMCGSSLHHMARTCREGKWEGCPRIAHREEAAPGARLGARTPEITNIIKKPPAPQVRCRHKGNNFWIPRLHHKNQEAGHTDRSQQNAHLLHLHGMWRTVHQHYDQSQLSLSSGAPGAQRGGEPAGQWYGLNLKWPHRLMLWGLLLQQRVRLRLVVDHVGIGVWH